MRTVGEARAERLFWEKVYLTSIRSGAAAEVARANAEQAVSDRRDYISALTVELALHDNPLTPVEQFVTQGSRIGAIKELRRLVPAFGLKEAKDTVDEWSRTGRWPSDLRVMIDRKVEAVGADSEG